MLRALLCLFCVACLFAFVLFCFCLRLCLFVVVCVVCYCWWVGTLPISKLSMYRSFTATTKKKKKRAGTQSLELLFLSFSLVNCCRSCGSSSVVCFVLFLFVNYQCCPLFVVCCTKNQNQIKNSMLLPATMSPCPPLVNTMSRTRPSSQHIVHYERERQNNKKREKQRER